MRIRARSFFEQALPLMLELRAEAFRTLGARVAFDLSGEGGGRWTLDCAACTVKAQDPTAAEVRVALPATDFDALMAGTLDVYAAQSAGTLRVEGNRAVLGALGPLLMTAAA